MDVKITSFIENEDGSAELSVDMDEEAKEFLLQYAFKSLLIDYTKHALEQKTKGLLDG